MKEYFVLDRGFGLVQFSTTNEGDAISFDNQADALNHAKTECQLGQVIQLVDGIYEPYELGQFIIVDYFYGIGPQILLDGSGSVMIFDSAEEAYDMACELEKAYLVKLGDHMID